MVTHGGPNVTHGAPVASYFQASKNGCLVYPSIYYQPPTTCREWNLFIGARTRYVAVQIPDPKKNVWTKKIFEIILAWGLDFLAPGGGANV